MSLAGVLLRIASWVAPAERGDWVRAMEAEYATLDTGRLSWAAGSLAVATGLRLRKDGVYLVLTCAALLFLRSSPFFVFEAQHLPRVFWDIGLYPPFYHLAAVGMLLGLYRPRLIVVTALALIIANNVSGTLSFYDSYLSHVVAEGAPHEDFWPFVASITINDAKPAAGILAQFGSCLLGGFLGRWIAGQLAKARARFTGVIPG